MLTVTTQVDAGEIAPTDLNVQVYFGQLNPDGKIETGQSIKMEIAESKGQSHTFSAHVPCKSTGKYGFSVRIFPYHESLPNIHEIGLVKWYNS